MSLAWFLEPTPALHIDIPKADYFDDVSLAFVSSLRLRLPNLIVLLPPGTTTLLSSPNRQALHCLHT